MNTAATLRNGVACATLLTLAGCGSLDGLTSEQATLAGAGAGALAGAVVSDGVIAPVAGAIGGAVIGKELSERDRARD